MMEFIAYPDREMLFLSLANRIAGELGQALRSGERASLSVPGVMTPGPLFDLLAEAPLEWGRVSVVLNDERWVPEDHARSNTGLLRDRLLKGPAAAAALVPMHLPGMTPEDALLPLSEAIAPHLPLTCAVVGMGEDRHTASLFPGADRLAEALSPDAPILLPMRAEAAGEPRMTLTAPVLRGALYLHVLILGTAKREAFETARNMPVELAPIRSIMDNAVIHWAE